MVCMNKVFFGTLISQASTQIQSISVHVLRAKSNFLTEKSIDLAMHDLKEVQRLLEQAKEAYIHNHRPSPTEYLK